VGRSDLRELLHAAVARDPAFAPAHAALGNVLVRGGNLADAIAAYARANELAAREGTFGLALGELTMLAGDEPAARAHLTAAFAHRRVFSPLQPPAGARHVLVLLVPAPWPCNVPLDFIVDRSRFALHKWYLTALADDDLGGLPAYDVVFDAIGASDEAAPALAFATRFAATAARATINDPRRVAATARPALAATLGGIAGCTVPATVRVAAAALDRAEIAFPLIARPVDRHGGRDAALVADAAALREHAARTGAATFDLTAFVDYRDADGLYRKYRIMFVDGRPYPYHLAAAGQWMIHYHRTTMAERADLRAEEARFIDDPAAVFPGWGTTMPAIAAALGLDYVGIDCARLTDGTVLVFEADTAMLVHANDAPEPFAYKEPAVARIAAALGDLIAGRCNLSASRG
jgi:glutathione synthase/RimK-type ligase-like ATP-grasp enzyme